MNSIELLIDYVLESEQNDFWEWAKDHGYKTDKEITDFLNDPKSSGHIYHHAAKLSREGVEREKI